MAGQFTLDGATFDVVNGICAAGKKLFGKCGRQKTCAVCYCKSHVLVFISTLEIVQSSKQIDDLVATLVAAGI